MQPHDPEQPTTPALLRDKPSHSRYPDESSRAEHGEVSTAFSPDTGRQTKRGVVIVAIVLILCFVLVSVVRYFHAHGVAEAGNAAYSRPPPVDVVIAKPATVGQDLLLPGETAAWYETTIYARVNGYVASWQVDIGDQVKKGPSLGDDRDAGAQCGARRGESSAASLAGTSRGTKSGSSF